MHRLPVDLFPVLGCDGIAQGLEECAAEEGILVEGWCVFIGGSGLGACAGCAGALAFEADGWHGGSLLHYFGLWASI